MQTKIVVDSCCDLTDELRSKFNISTAPLSIDIGGETLIDDHNLDREYLLQKMKENSKAPKTASPSPETFLDLYKKHDNTFVVTLSDKLSSTYQNAVLAKQMLLEQDKDKFVHVFNSFSAASGETMTAVKLGELIESGLNKKEIIEKTNDYIAEMQTLFVLDSVDNLIKAGRMNKVKGKLASFFNIKPILAGADDGTITLLDKARGSKRTIKKLVDKIDEKGKNLENKILGISHCNALKKAEYIREEAYKRFNFRDIIIVEAAGISTVYANEGGIITAF
jgi:DegV family protein with EDD domain